MFSTPAVPAAAPQQSRSNKSLQALQDPSKLWTGTKEMTSYLTAYSHLSLWLGFCNMVEHMIEGEEACSYNNSICFLVQKAWLLML